MYVCDFYIKYIIVLICKYKYMFTCRRWLVVVVVVVVVVISTRFYY